jgi:hypothetical protein
LGLAVGTPGGTAQAASIIDITQVGPDVVTTGSGTLNLTGLGFTGTSITVGPELVPGLAIAFVGFGAVDFYFGASGPLSFGPSFATHSTGSGSGVLFGISGFDSTIFVPQGYVSGTPLSATNTYANQTFSSLGLTPGTYVFTWSSDSLTVVIALVPEPASIVHVGIGGLMGIVYYAWRRRRAKPPA